MNKDREFLISKEYIAPLIKVDLVLLENGLAAETVNTGSGGGPQVDDYEDGGSSDFEFNW